MRKPIRNRVISTKQETAFTKADFKNHIQLITKYLKLNKMHIFFSRNDALEYDYYTADLSKRLLIRKTPTEHTAQIFIQETQK
jgi:hypothetical protein